MARVHPSPKLSVLLSIGPCGVSRMWLRKLPEQTQSRAFRPLKRTGSSFCLVAERRNQKEAPGVAPSGHPVLHVRAWRRVVSTAHPCTDETMADIVSATLRAIPPPCAATQGPNSGGHPARMVRACLRAVAPESPFSPCGRLQAQDAPANSEAGPEGERHGVARVTCRRRKRGVFA